jgi:hypothetical protein
MVDQGSLSEDDGALEMINEVALIVGNGSSRKSLDLLGMANILGGNRPTIYGCNALYREYRPNYIIPDFLVAMDEGAIAEIESSDFPSERFIVPPDDDRWEPAEMHSDGHRPRSNAGMCAMIEAIRRGATTLLCIGFDSFLKDASQSVSNLFDGTTNYGPETRANVWDNPGRVKFMAYLARKNPNVDFVFIYPEGMEAVPIGEKNIYQTTFEELTRSTQ